MDIIGQFANLRGIGADQALEETLPWMLHCLNQRDVENARACITRTDGVHAAVAAAFGCEGGARLLQGYYNEQNRIITADPFAPPPDPNAPTAEEIAYFVAIEKQALAAQQTVAR